MKRAIDIVLLPPQEITDYAISLNKPWVKGIEDEIELNSETCLPHITLVMGVMDDSQLEEVSKILEEISQEFSELDLTIPSVEVYDQDDGSRMSGLAIERTQNLQKLHETIVDRLVPLFTYDDVTKEMFSSPPAVNAVPMWWVKGFAKSSIRDKYNPHITLGMGVASEDELPKKFKASRLALCHLGTYCTCRKIIKEFKLS